VLASCCLRVTLEQVSLLRQRPGPGVGELLPANFLKHADEQTVVGLAAVLQAIEAASLAERKFTDWGVVAAPSFLGRATLVSALQRYSVEGAWGLSPHFIPHRSQHAISGTISQALKIHGPNFGTGGSPRDAVEALFAGAVLVEDNRLPGVWIVLTGWEPEQIPDSDGRTDPYAICQALAIALGAMRTGSTGPRLRVVFGAGAESQPELASRIGPSLSALRAAFGALGDTPVSSTTVIWQLAGGGWIELSHGSRSASVASPTCAPRPNGRMVTGPLPTGAGTE
jgi:hypothetical protein